MLSVELSKRNITAINHLIESICSKRFLVIRILEPNAFKFCPDIPAIFLPWKLSENHYFPSHLTLVLFTVLDSCLVSPVVEEALKLIALKAMVGRRAVKKTNNIGGTDLGPAEFAPRAEHTLKSYVVVMTAVSLGLKVADSIRRILLYTHANQKHKMFFALARSVFPGKHYVTVPVAVICHMDAV
jgi:hypothetical protein